MRATTFALGGLLVATPVAAQLPATPAQTEGPYYPSRQRPVETDNDLTRLSQGPQAKGDIVLIKGTVVDLEGQVIADARVEIWQADHQGIYMHPDDPNTARRDRTFQFYGETRSDASGAFVFRTIIPARYPGRARHIHAKVTPPGGATLTTQFYFEGDRALDGDGVARQLGTRLADVMLAPRPDASSGVLEASVRLVIRGATRRGQT